MSTLAGWGRLPEPGTEVLDEDLERLTRGAVLSRGLGRSYGDSSLPAHPGDKVALASKMKKAKSPLMRRQQSIGASSPA